MQKHILVIVLLATIVNTTQSAIKRQGELLQERLALELELKKHQLRQHELELKLRQCQLEIELKKHQVRQHQSQLKDYQLRATAKEVASKKRAKKDEKYQHIRQHQSQLENYQLRATKEEKYQYRAEEKEAFYNNYKTEMMEQIRRESKMQSARSLKIH